MTADNLTILLLEDDPNDEQLLQLAFERAGIRNPLYTVPNGVEGIAYLKGEGKYADRNAFPIPKVIILDLKMPLMGGIEFLRCINEHPDLRVVPTIILSASNLAEDVQNAYDLKAHTYFVKPTSFPDLEAMVKAMRDYWQRALTPKPKNM